LPLLTATVFFAFQIYCDFSGYSDTARGVARMLGFEIARNFNFPYISRTPVEFWQRWHISLSQWFQDYLYFPLAMRYMRRRGFLSKYKAHIISMALIGIWHGANWTFLAFGLYWGCVIALYLAAVERTRSAQRTFNLPLVASRTVRDACAIALMFAIVSIGWVLFRAASIGDAWHVLSRAFTFQSGPDVTSPAVLAEPLLWLLIVGLCVAEWAYRQWDGVRGCLAGGRWPALAGRYALLATIIVSTGASQVDEARPFIYFQF
jgi:D-alanyl-lipoteichoic acid acyltransferase DltB (MBOAT superfamily)